MAANDGVRVGDPAPDFTLPSASGDPVSLRDFRGTSEVVLFFYPKDSSLVCTAEACAFRDSHDAFTDLGATVLGISADSSASHRTFATRRRLPYLLLTDSDGSIRALFGVPRTLGLIPGRVTYVIDRHGIVRHIVSSPFQPARHVAEALRALKALRDEHARSPR